MKSFFYTIFLSFSLSLIFGCATTPNQLPSMISKIEYAPNFYAKHPKSILVLPAINTTSAADASDQFRFTITKPLAEQGYYVFPVHLVDSFFKSENLPDAELVRNIPVKKLKEVFLADAILYVDIINWDTDYSVVKSSVDVGFAISLIDATSEEEIWQGNIFSYKSTRANNSDALVALISLIDVAIGAGVEYTDLSIEANEVAVNNFPCGPYQKDYQKDQNELLNISESIDKNVRGYYNPIIRDNQLRIGKMFIKDDVQTPPPTGSLKLKLDGFTRLSPGKAHHIINSYYLNHSGFNDYYYYHKEKGKKYLRHRFFFYEDNKPFLFSANNKVFVKTIDEGKILYTKSEVTNIWNRPLIGEPVEYLFDIDRIVNLSAKM